MKDEILNIFYLVVESQENKKKFFEISWGKAVFVVPLVVISNSQQNSGKFSQNFLWDQIFSGN